MLFKLDTPEHQRNAIGSVVEVYASKWSNLTTLECRKKDRGEFKTD
jgi:hypothetical protein